jgi:hypothetical protein
VAASLAWRMEGLRRYDLFGDSHGWRRPGTAMFVEPGVSYTAGAHTLSVNVPIGYYYNRHRNPYTGNPGDATFPKHVFLTSYSFRLGSRSGRPATDQPPAPATPPPRREDAAGPAASAATRDTSQPFCLPPVAFR